MDWSQIIDKLKEWGNNLVALLPNIVLAIVAIVLAVFIAKLVKKWLRRAGRKITDNKTLTSLLATTTQVIIIIIGLVIALRFVKLEGAVASALAGAGIIGLALGFAFQDIASNFISGVIIALQRPFKIGELIETNDFFGTVKNISLRTTEIRTLQGNSVLIPNQDILLNPMINYSQIAQRRIDLEVGVAYGDDLEKAKKVALESINSLDIVINDKPIDLYYSEFGSSSINFTIRFWAKFKKQTDYLEARSQAVMAIKEAFDKNDITIPFPIRTIDFGVVGGDHLKDITIKHKSK